MRPSDALPTLLTAASLLALGCVSAPESPAKAQAETPQKSIAAPVVHNGATPHIRQDEFFTVSHEGQERAIRIEVDGAERHLSVDDLAWLEGRWLGTGLGGVCEETWSPALGEGKERSMVGMFRLYENGGKLNFYELMTLVHADDGTVTLRLVHLSRDLTPWEKPGETTDFRLLDFQGTTAWFEGLTMHREGDELVIYVAMHQQAGGLKEGVLRYRLTAAGTRGAA